MEALVIALIVICMLLVNIVFTNKLDGWVIALSIILAALYIVAALLCK